MGRQKTHNEVEFWRGKVKELEKENRRLKKQVRQAEKFNVDKVEDDEQYTEVKALEQLKRRWACSDCGVKGILEIVRYHKGTDEWYYRCCNSCNKRTRGQRFTEKVEGIFKL